MQSSLYTLPVVHVHSPPWRAEAPWPSDSLLEKSWQAKTCKEPPWDLPALTQKMRFSSGPHPLPLFPASRLADPIGFLAWPWTCPLSGTGMMATGPLAVSGHGPDTTPLSSLG